MTQYKKYLENNYTKATVDIYLKDITIFNTFLKLGKYKYIMDCKSL